jgi:predicted Zn-dependent peptidase
MKEIAIKESGEKVYNEKLSNGLDVYMYPTNKEGYTLFLTTKYGGKHLEFKLKDESEYHKIPYGVAHFLEHITFHMDGYDVDELFAPYGASINANTTHDRTCYTVDNNTNFKECLEILLDYVYTPYYTEESVEHEKGIIKEERKRSDDDVNRQFAYLANESLFHNSYYRGTVLGTLDEIDSITLDDINHAYNTFYNPNNMFLVITGNFDKDEALDIVKNKMSEFNFDNNEIDIRTPIEPPTVVDEYKEVKLKVLDERVKYTIKIPVKDIAKTGLSFYEYANYLDMILDINFGGTSSYYEEIINNDISLYNSSNITYLCDDYLCVTLSNKVKQGKKDELIKLTEKYLNNMVVTDKEIKRKYKCLLADQILQYDDYRYVANIINFELYTYGEFHDDFLAVMKNFNEDIAKNIIDNLDLSNKSVLVAIPE